MSRATSARRATYTTSCVNRDARAPPGSSRASTRWRRSSTCSTPIPTTPPRAGSPPSRQEARVAATETTKVAYYKGCLASLSAKELDTSTQALAPKLGLELEELESVTCCGAGDIHEAEPDYYLHLNARILAYAEATGAETLMTICNVCTLNLRQANHILQNDDAVLNRVNDNLRAVGVPPYSGGVEVRHFLWLVADGEGHELLKQSAHRGLKGLKIAPFYGCQI